MLEEHVHQFLMQLTLQVLLPLHFVTLFAASLTMNLSAFRADVVVCDKSDDGRETKEG